MKGNKNIKSNKRRTYNKKLYNTFKKGNGFIRNKVTPDPLNQFNEYGVLGKVVNKIGNSIIKTPIHNITRNIVGNMYNPKTEKPYKGSFLYTVVKIFVCLIISIFVFGFSNMVGVFRWDCTNKGNIIKLLL